MNASIQSVQGGTRLAFDSVEGITNTVERMHKTIARRALPWSQLVYGAERGHGLTASAVYAKTILILLLNLNLQYQELIFTNG